MPALRVHIPQVRLLANELGPELSHTEIFARMIELQPTHWPEAKRPFQPIDIEYLCCECRKYYSYVNGTKGFEGKNVFVPGESPLLSFDEGPDPTALGEAPDGYLC